MRHIYWQGLLPLSVPPDVDMIAMTFMEVRTIVESYDNMLYAAYLPNLPPDLAPGVHILAGLAHVGVPAPAPGLVPLPEQVVPVEDGQAEDDHGDEGHREAPVADMLVDHQGGAFGLEEMFVAAPVPEPVEDIVDEHELDDEDHAAAEDMELGFVPEELLAILDEEQGPEFAEQDEINVGSDYEDVSDVDD